jgi:hypothetical protein
MTGSRQVGALIAGVCAILALVGVGIKYSEEKTISYRGGLVTFSLPRPWKEEYAPEGGGTFFDDRADAGTLRLNVMTVSSPHETVADYLRTTYPAGPPALTNGGFPLEHDVRTATEGSNKLLIYKWMVTVATKPGTFRLFIFQHTILASQVADPRIVAEVKFLNRSIRAATYSVAPGVGGAYYQ